MDGKQTHGKHVLDGGGTPSAPPSPPPFLPQPTAVVNTPSMALVWHGRRFIFCERAITIHSLPSLPHAHVLLRVGHRPASPQWALWANYCLRVETWVISALLAQGWVRRLSPSHARARLHVHTAAEALSCAMLTPSFCFSIPFFPVQANLLTLGFFFFFLQ